MVFICFAYRGDVEKNVAKASGYARFAVLCGYSPVIPHLTFCQFLLDDKPDERIKGIELGIVQMKQCEMLWIFGTDITEGMAYEIEKAKELGIPVAMLDTDCSEIKPETLKIDDSVDAEFRRKVNGLKYED